MRENAAFEQATCSPVGYSYSKVRSCIAICQCKWTRLDARLVLGFVEPKVTITIHGGRATISAGSEEKNVTLPCELPFQNNKDRKSITLNLKAEIGFCNSKLTFVSVALALDYSIALAEVRSSRERKSPVPCEVLEK